MSYLSKSSFVRGWQCEKSLFLNFYHQELKDPISPQQQAIFDAGHLVGREAQRLFPGGADASRGHFERIAEAVKYTQELISNGQKVIYEAAFEFEENICYLDILVKEGDSWKAYEVKGSTDVKEYYYQDLSFQYYVITNSGLPLEDILLVHLNKEYVRHGPLEPEKLFKTVSMQDEVTGRLGEIKESIDRFRGVLLQREIPEVDIGPHCDNPYTCDFKGYCWRHVPGYSVFDLAGLAGEKKWELYRQGILELKDIPGDYPLKPKQRQQIEAELTGERFINKDKVREFLEGLKYPLYYLDFESFQSPVPLFENSRSYQQIPFQYSLHIQDSAGAEPLHREFLAEAAGDPRSLFLQHLLGDIGEEGDIIIYNRSFEASRLKELGKDFPAHQQDVERLNDRMKDLMKIFQERHYYSPEMKGSYSIKYVLPALVSGIGYEALEIGEGSLASMSFAQLYHETDLFNIMTVRENLLRYCEMDTKGMVEVVSAISH